MEGGEKERGREGGEREKGRKKEHFIACVT